MGVNKLLFKEATNYSEILEILDKNIEPVHIRRFFSETFTAAKKSLDTAKTDQQSCISIRSYASHIDKKMNHPSQVNCNAFIKIPTLLAGSLYITKFPDSIKGFSNDEIQTLSLYSTTMPLTFFEMASRYFPKELIEVVNQKTDDYNGRSFLMHLTEKYFNIGQTPKQITNYYKNSTLDELLDDFTNYMVEQEAEELKELEQNKK